MSNTKQSSIEWLDNELTSLNFDYITGQIDNKEYNERHKVILEQAKAMHKEEIKEAREDGHTSTYTEYDSDTKLYLEGRHEQYYNETFNK